MLQAGALELFLGLFEVALRLFTFALELFVQALEVFELFFEPRDFGLPLTELLTEAGTFVKIPTTAAL